MATRAAAQKPDGSRREVVRRVRVWKRALLRVSDTASTLASYQWVQTSEVAKSAADRAAKRPKLTPFKDEKVKPIPTRARSERTIQDFSTFQTSQEPTQMGIDSTAAPNTRAAVSAAAADTSAGTDAGKDNPAPARVAAASSVPSRPASVTPHSTPGSSKQPEGGGRGGPAAGAPSVSNSPAAVAPSKPPISAAKFSFGGTSDATAAKSQEDSQPGQSTAGATTSPAKFTFGASATSATAAAKFTFGKPAATTNAPSEPKKFNFGAPK